MAWEDYQKESTETLIEIIQWKDDTSYAENAKDAFWAFTMRFSKPLLEKLVPVCRSWKKEDAEAYEIGTLVFERFWKKPATFSPGKCKRHIDTCVLFYLMRMAQNILNDEKRQQQRDIANPYTGEEEICEYIEGIYDPPTEGAVEKKAELTKKHAVLKRALETLPEKQRVIYLTYLTHEKPGHKMPRKLLENLRVKLELSQNAVQVYKHLAEKHVKIYLDAYARK